MLAASFLEHNSWLPGVVVAVVLFALTWLINLKLRKRDRKSKTFDYCVLSDVAILSHRPEDNQLKVTYLDQEIDNPRVVQVEFVNSGTEVIRAAEILEQYVVSVQNTWLVSVSMAHASSPNLAQFAVEAAEAAQKIRLTLATLNPGDHFTLQMLLDHQGRTAISVAGRIEGQTRPSGKIVTRPETYHFTISAWLSAFFAASLIGAGATIYLAEKNEFIGVFVPALLATLGLYAGAGTWVALATRRRFIKGSAVIED